MSGQFKEEFYRTIQQLLVQEKHQIDSIVAGLQILFVMVNEFSSMKKSEIGLSLEFHERARVAFQKETLPYAFNAALTMAQDCGKILLQGDRKEQIITVMRSALKLLLEVLCWDFSPFDERTTFKRAVPVSKTGESIPILLEPLEEEWKTTLANIQIIDLLASVRTAYLFIYLLSLSPA